MALTIDETQDALLAYLDAQIGVDVVEQSVPSLETLPRDANGNVKPYVALQFGDIMPVTGGEGFAGALYDDYRLPIYLQAIGPNAKTARQLSNFITGLFLGQQFIYSGDVRKRMGGQMWPMEENNVGVVAYVAPLSFSLLVQVAIA